MKERNGTKKFQIPQHEKFTDPSDINNLRKFKKELKNLFASYRNTEPLTLMTDFFVIGFLIIFNY